jgi:hypothetical protein
MEPIAGKDRISGGAHHYYRRPIYLSNSAVFFTNMVENMFS